MTRETIRLCLLSCNDITLYLFSNQIVSLMDLILLHDIVHFSSAVCLHNACHQVWHSAISSRHVEDGHHDDARAYESGVGCAFEEENDDDDDDEPFAST